MNRGTWLRLPDPAREAFVSLLPGQIVEVAVTDQRVGRFVGRRSKLFRHLLHGPESVRHKDRILADAFPDQRGAGDSAAGTLDDNAFAVTHTGSLCRRRMDLNETDAIHLLANVSPLRHPGEVNNTGPADDSHQRKFLVNVAGRY